ncbi:MAG: hypothetical protein AAFY71_28555 [Bacteroidota bacterium]
MILLLYPIEYNEIPIHTVKEIPWQGLEEIWQEALIIDQFKWEQKKK